MNKSKFMFLIIMMLGTLITLSSNNWMSMWMGLEINMISFIPLISLKKSKNSSEANMIYFLVQSISSMMLLFSIIMVNSEMQLFNYPLIMSLLMKLGAAPFHMWFPEILSKMEWFSCFMLMTWQKIAPLSIMSNIQLNNKIMFIVIILSTMVGGLGGLNQTSLRKIMAYSSINHLGWMLSINKIQNNWCNYLIIYSIMIMLICFLFNQNNMLYINQINSMNMTIYEKYTMIFMFLSLGGLPPFLGFMPKWMVINILINDKSYFMLFMMIMFSMITLYYYMNIMINMLLNFSSINKWILTKNNNLLNSVIMIINFSLPIIMIYNFM